MPIREKQLLITDIVASVLGEKPIIDKKFDWFINKHTIDSFKGHYHIIDRIFKSLNGDISANQLKRKVALQCDAYFSGNYNFIFEFDEGQHFGTIRLKSLEFYPKYLKLNFDPVQWKEFCLAHKKNSDKYRSNKKTKDFNFEGGRNAQRAYLDCFRDLLPQFHGLNPTLRISEFEVEGIQSNSKESCKKIELILKEKLLL